jgi:DNA-binding response OmpR family regulator
MRTILCVEDELDILENNRKAIVDAGYTALTAASVAGAREILQNQTPDAVVLDIMLPDGNGLDLLHELREAGNKVPIIMLTAWGKPSDIARGLNLGANDYLSKPFSYEVLLARVEAMFRNAEEVPETVTRGRFTLNIAAAQAFLDGADMLLTQKEFGLLLLFVQNENRVVSAEYLYEKIWKAPMSEDDSAVKTAVSRLRKKTEGGGYTISVARGEGYCFEPLTRFL